MALVHIIGDPQPAEQLAQQLRDHGCEIEIFPPGTQSSSAADLEIILEQCSSEIVLSKAVAIAQDQNACLLVSSGVLPEVLSGNQEDISYAESPTATQQVPDSVAATINLASNSVDHTPTDVPPISVFEELAQAAGIGFCVPPSLTERREVSTPLQESSPENASDWPIWQTAVEEAALSESFVAPLPLKQYAGNNTTVLLRNARQVIRWTSDHLRMVADDRRFVRIAMATAAIAIAGLLFAATFHRFSPLSPRLTRGSNLASQPVPFQKLHADASSANRASDQPVPTPAPAPAVQARSAKVLRASGQLTSDDAGLIAKDIVIRYGSRSASRHIFSDPIHPGVKYYSDLSPTNR